jgi:hypothetical protein
MLGSVSEAEDVVQEALLRVHQALDAGERIASPRALIATVSTRLAINELRSARARRERYVGEWLPEPIITDGHDDPARHAETADSARALTARAQPRRAHSDQLAPPGRPPPGVSLRPVEVSGAPGVLYLDAQQRLISVVALEIGDGQITGISSIVNPDKLTHLGPVADFASLLKSAK